MTKSCMDIYDESELNRARAVYWWLISVCYDETCAKYKEYGAKGFTVCNRWRDSLLAFIEDMGHPPVGAKARMKRAATVFNNENMRWAEEQQKSTERLIEYQGHTLSISKWSQLNGVPVDIMKFRLDKLQWSIERVLTTPIYTKNEAMQRLTYLGETKTQQEWSDICGISEREIPRRLKQGWSIEKTLTTPKKTSRKFILYGGEFRLLSKWAALYSLPHSVLYGRLANGWTVEQALITPLAPKLGNKSKKDYYTKDKSLGTGQKGYYDEDEAKALSEEMTVAVWFGKGAQRLNLVGHAQQSDFAQIYDGYIPGTQERIREGDYKNGYRENSLYDLVLVCKKSVSMQIHLGKDERLYKAYQETVLEVAKQIEDNYAQSKKQVNGERNVVQAEGIIALLMPHHTTRELDMDVHTHVLIANGAYCEDGQWRSLQGVRVSQPYFITNYFSARMAVRVQELGYEIRERVTEQGHPSWELAGYADEQIRVFCKQSEDEAVRALIAKGYSSDDALIDVRKAKEVDENLEQMQARWSAEAQEHGIEAIIPQAHAINPRQKTPTERIFESIFKSKELQP